MAIPRAFASLFLVLLLVSPLCCMARDILYPGESLKSGQYLTAGKYRFVMEKNCNLVLLQEGNAKPRWTSGTADLGQDCYLSFKTTDGDMVIYDKNKKVVWKRGFSLAQGDYVLILDQNKGEVAIYGSKRYQTNIKVTSFGDLPANKAAEEAKTASISMVVNN
ncbi:alpha-D-mannose-specific plant lectins domain-containing protein [Dioscorea alata]|uniref:Alpha-D-mannose-specific plant lectins domain-containing protein n=1 Tax=Dioscorea alata TaxID=55571 RepID=A0ACB7WMS6_DIOAL|nr:alpha-D-mannose-specific plant lectins domain-containing protein [Dioscorea alata]